MIRMFKASVYKYVSPENKKVYPLEQMLKNIWVIVLNSMYELICETLIIVCHPPYITCPEAICCWRY